MEQDAMVNVVHVDEVRGESTFQLGDLLSYRQYLLHTAVGQGEKKGKAIDLNSLISALRGQPGVSLLCYHGELVATRL